MIALQEELDWLVYRAFGLTADTDLTVLLPDDLPGEGLALGHRPFEIVLARRVQASRFETSWFERHGSQAVTDVPEFYPVAYRQLLERRVAFIESRPRDVGLIEQPDKKRRWSAPNRATEARDAARSWLLDQVEDAMKSGTKRLWSYDDVAQLIDASPKRRAVLQLALGSTEPSADSARHLLEQDTVPGVAALRYQPSGLDKHRRWRAVWERQAREDRGETVERGPKPPEFKPADFRGSAWSCRGKLDVPKERFVLFPQASDEDTPRDLLAWAGWDELAQARLLAPLINRHLQRMDAADSAHAERVVPLFCAIEERIFWVRLWHPEPDPEFNVVWADYLDEFIRGKLPKLSLPKYRTRDDLAAWEPQSGKGARKVAKRKPTPADQDEADVEAGVLVAARPRRTRSSPPAPSLEAIVTRLRELGGEATAQNLAEALGVKPAALKKVTTPAVGTTLKLVKKKPVTYALLPEGGEHA